MIDEIMQPKQLSLFPSKKTKPFNYPFPSTRYQGSKRKLVDWIWENVSQLEFNTVLDVFGGTGAVSHLFKNAGKQVIYNDVLSFNHTIGQALIENSDQRLSEQDIETLINIRKDIIYPNFIETNFENIYFTSEENRWLDCIVYHINHLLNNPYKQAIARFALFQSCIIKRPYNLFHRANLYMRTSDVKRNFGNKTTWDTPFEMHFRQFVNEANQAIFDNGQKNQAIQGDALDTPTDIDLVYLDPPYLNQKGVGVDYRDFYHFLEGLMNYQQWGNEIDYDSKHRRLQRQTSIWNKPTTIYDAFEKVIEHHQNSILVISYRDDGIPSRTELMTLLNKFKSKVYSASQHKKYVLSHKRSKELLLIGI